RPGMAGARVFRVARRLDVRPAPVEPIGVVRLVALARFELGIEFCAPLQTHLLDLSLADDALANKLFGIDLGDGRMLADRLVHQRLSEGPLVSLVLSEAPIAGPSYY